MIPGVGGLSGGVAIEQDRDSHGARGSERSAPPPQRMRHSQGHRRQVPPPCSVRPLRPSLHRRLLRPNPCIFFHVSLSCSIHLRSLLSTSSSFVSKPSAPMRCASRARASQLFITNARSSFLCPFLPSFHWPLDAGAFMALEETSSSTSTFACASLTSASRAQRSQAVSSLGTYLRAPLVAREVKLAVCFPTLTACLVALLFHRCLHCLPHHVSLCSRDTMTGTALCLNACHRVQRLHGERHGTGQVERTGSHSSPQVRWPALE